MILQMSTTAYRCQIMLIFGLQILLPICANWYIIAFSVSPTAKDNVVNYIIHQKEHHKRVNYEDEYRRLCEMSGVAFVDDDLT